MTLLRAALIALLLSTTAAFAAPPSDESINQLLEITRMKNMLDGIQAQASVMVDNIVRQQLHGAAPTPDQQRAIDNLRVKMVELFKQNLSWAKIAPTSMQIYKETFSQDEVNGMIAFYKTPAGQAVVTKMPTLLQKMMAQVQIDQQQMGPQIQQIVRDYCTDQKITCN